MTVKSERLELQRIGPRLWQVWYGGELVADGLRYEQVRPLMLGRVTVEELLQRVTVPPDGERRQ